MYSGLAAMTIGCSTSDNNTSRYVDRYSFDNFGEVYKGRQNYMKALAVGDVDGDGDLDIIMAKEFQSARSHIVILENKMPQKNSK